MDIERGLRFEALEVADRQRIAQAIGAARSGNTDGPIVLRLASAAPTSRVLPGLIFATLAALLLAGLLEHRFGQLGTPGVISTPPMRLGWALLAAASLGALVWAVPRHWWQRGPDTRGIWAFADHIVDAREPIWIVRSLDGMRELRASAAGKQGAVERFRIAITARDGRRWFYIAHGRAETERALARWRDRREALLTAGTQGSREAMRSIDPMVGVVTTGAGKPMAWLRRVPIPIVVSVLVGAGLGTPIQILRDRASDDRQWAEARQLNTELAYLRYLQHPLQHADAARAALPRAALRDAQREGTVTALRSALSRYPGAGLDTEVASDIRAIYARALDRFKQGLRREDSALVQVVEAALRQAEASGDPRVAVVFVRPAASQVQLLDNMLRRGTLYPAGVAAASAHFQGDTAQQRESRMWRELKQAFATVFPADVLAAATTDREPQAQMPRLTIDYSIRPSGMVYRSEMTGRQFIGVTIGFAAEMRAAAGGPSWRFGLEVAPPDRFTVSERTPGDGSVYAVMADRAFDELGSKLVRAFFGPR